MFFSAHSLGYSQYVRPATAKRPDPLWSAPSLLFHGHLGSRGQGEADYSVASSTKFEDGRDYPSTSAYSFVARARTTSILTFLGSHYTVEPLITDTSNKEWKSYSPNRLHTVLDKSLDELQLTYTSYNGQNFNSPAVSVIRGSTVLHFSFVLWPTAVIHTSRQVLDNNRTSPWATFIIVTIAYSSHSCGRVGETRHRSTGKCLCQ